MALVKDEAEVHIHFIVGLFLIMAVRLWNYLKISEFLKQNEK